VKTAIVIVNWNGKHLLKNCLEATLMQKHDDYSVILVDNGSTDGSVEYVKENFSQVNAIELKENSGFAKGNNVGIDFALKDDDVQNIVCLNNDTIVQHNWLEELIKTANSNKNIGAVSSKAYFEDGVMIQNAGLIYSNTLQINKAGGVSLGYGKTDAEAPELATDCEIFAAGGVAALFKRTVVESIIARDGEFFDEDFFAYAEDYDLGFRIRSLGYTAALSAQAKLVHLHSQSVGKASLLKAYYLARNIFLTITKNMPLTDVLLYPFRDGWMKMKSLLSHHDSTKDLQAKIGTFAMAKTYGNAVFDALRLTPKMLRKRRNILKKPSR
jgi:GT2 family glycosyltransferase